MVTSLPTKEDVATLAALVAQLAEMVAHRYPDDEQIAGLARAASMFATVKVAQAQREREAGGGS